MTNPCCGATTPVFFAAVERFAPDMSGSWDGYIKWCGLKQVQEVISLDLTLCPTMFEDLTDEDWKHNVQQDNMTSFFVNLDYVIQRFGHDEAVNILAVMHNPSEADTASFTDARFHFCGFDLVEPQTRVSALVNCGGFPKAFDNSELNVVGLLFEYDRALDVQKKLRAEYAEEPHADCDLWAIWRLKRD